MTRSGLCGALALGALVLTAWGARAQDASELIVRLNRLEGQMRQLSGQVEQLGHENRQLKERLQKFGEDVEFRFQEQQKRPAPAASKPERPGRRSDAAEPDAAPAAPTPSKPAGRDGIAAVIEKERDAAPPRPALGPDAKGVSGLNPDFGKPTGSTAPAGAAKGRYDAAYAAYTQKQYGQAEGAFRDFIRDNPRDRLVGDATYWLGESYLRQNKAKEAAQQFLKVTQEHGKSARAPDAMLKLGASLSSLGAKDQACAALAELGRKYPGAAEHVKQGAAREQKKAGCAA